jgi:hypothetical protein
MQSDCRRKSQNIRKELRSVWAAISGIETAEPEASEDERLKYVGTATRLSMGGERGREKRPGRGEIKEKYSARESAGRHRGHCGGGREGGAEGRAARSDGILGQREERYERT